MNAARRLLWFRRLALCGAILAGCVVVLGAWVRLTDAGLGCPDWPGCYGHLYPTAAEHAAKAWHEMVHRYLAGSLALVIASLLALALVNRKVPDQPLVPVALLFLIVCVQATLGALTVTLLLTPLIVTLHLLGGLSTLGLLCWLARTPERRLLAPQESRLRGFALIGLGALFVQITLGGWTSSNYAAVACPDLPTCQGAWWPDMDFRDAFVPWRGLGVDFSGGVLAMPARTAIHFTHRVGAVLAGSILLCLGIVVLLRARAASLTLAGGLVVSAVVLQIGIGLATVHFGFPLPLATLHNAGAALLVASLVNLLRALWPGTRAGMVPWRP